MILAVIDVSVAPAGIANPKFVALSVEVDEPGPLAVAPSSALMLSTPAHPDMFVAVPGNRKSVHCMPLDALLVEDVDWTELEEPRELPTDEPWLALDPLDTDEAEPTDEPFDPVDDCRLLLAEDGLDEELLPCELPELEGEELPFDDGLLEGRDEPPLLASEDPPLDALGALDRLDDEPLLGRLAQPLGGEKKNGMPTSTSGICACLRHSR